MKIRRWQQNKRLEATIDSCKGKLLCPICSDTGFGGSKGVYSTLFDHSNNVIREIFNPVDAHNILKMPIYLNAVEDVPIWKISRNG